eukprot:9495514-Pyramimonas_sp.AAC.1
MLEAGVLSLPALGSSEGEGLLCQPLEGGLGLAAVSEGPGRRPGRGGQPGRGAGAPALLEQLGAAGGSHGLVLRAAAGAAAGAAGELGGAGAPGLALGLGPARAAPGHGAAAGADVARSAGARARRTRTAPPVPRSARAAGGAAAVRPGGGRRGLASERGPSRSSSRESRLRGVGMQHARGLLGALRAAQRGA